MGKIKDFFEKIKNYFKRNASQSETSKPTIEILGRHESQPVHHTPSNSDTPRITIGEVYKRTPTAAGSNVNVQNTSLGHEITVKQQRKPGRCPLCATKGKIVANTGGGDRWRCEECGSTFN